MSVIVASTACCCAGETAGPCVACGTLVQSVPSAIAALITFKSSQWVSDVEFTYGLNFQIGPFNRCGWVALGEQIKNVPHVDGMFYTRITLKGVSVAWNGIGWAATSTDVNYAELKIFKNDGTSAGVTTIVTGFGNKPCGGPITPIGIYGTAGVGPVWTVVS